MTTTVNAMCTRRIRLFVNTTPNSETRISSTAPGRASQEDSKLNSTAVIPMSEYRMKRGAIASHRRNHRRHTIATGMVVADAAATIQSAPGRMSPDRAEKVPAEPTTTMSITTARRDDRAIRSRVGTAAGVRNIDSTLHRRGHPARPRMTSNR